MPMFRVSSALTFLSGIVLATAVLAQPPVVVPAPDPDSVGAGTPVGLREFIERSARNDPMFEEILIEELELGYRRTLSVPARDLVLSVRSELGLNLEGEPQAGLDAALTGIFPASGASVSLAWQRRSFGSTGAQNDVALQAGVDIARNAFGRGYRWTDSLAGLENIVARHQIIEAYEEYLAALLERFYRWASAFESIRAARAAVQEAGRLVDNTEAMRRSRIAYQVDVDKARLQMLGKRQRLLEAEDAFHRLTLSIAYSLGLPGDVRIYPDSAFLHISAEGDREAEQRAFLDSGRTMRILSRLEERDSLAAILAADALLPSAQVFTGVGWGDGPGSLSENTRGFVGLSVDWGWNRPREKASVDLARLEWGRRKLATQNRQGALRTDLDALRARIRAQAALLDLTRQRLELTESILRAETEEYRYGRSDINDFIRALEDFQEARFQRINSEIERDLLIVEWRRVTDQLVVERDTGRTPRRGLEDLVPGRR